MTKNKTIENNFATQYLMHSESFALKVIEFYLLVQLALTSAGITLYISNKISLIFIPLLISVIFGLLILFCVLDIYMRIELIRYSIRQSSNMSWNALENKTLFYFLIFITTSSFSLAEIGLASVSDLITNKLHLNNEVVLFLSPVVLYLALAGILYCIIKRQVNGNMMDLETFHKERIREYADKFLPIFEETTQVTGKEVKLIQNKIQTLINDPSCNKTELQKLKHQLKILNFCITNKSKLKKEMRALEKMVEADNLTAEKLLSSISMLDKLSS